VKLCHLLQHQYAFFQIVFKSQLLLCPFFSGYLDKFIVCLQWWVALCIGTNSSAWLGTAALVTNMRNFPLSRGTVAGLIKGYVAVSAAVYTETFTLRLDHWN
jgi:hypothetical protein